MRTIVFLSATLLSLPLMADPLECMIEGTAEQIAEHLPPGSVVYRDCYHCQQPAFEVIKIDKTALRPCHLSDSGSERALYISGTVERRFQMEKCGEITKEEKVQLKLTDELLILNYAWLYDQANGQATNIADSFGENSHHRCKRFSDRAQKGKKK